MSDCISRKAIIDRVEKQYCAPCKRQDGDLDENHCCSCVINDVLERYEESLPLMLPRCGLGSG